MAAALSPWRTKCWKVDCRVIGSGVVKPVGWKAESPARPTPKVPMTPQPWPSRSRACAVHHEVEVLPLVPVTATTSRWALGSP